MMRLKAVVLPAPLGPMSASVSFSRTVKLTSCTARRPPKRLERSWTTSASAMSGLCTTTRIELERVARDPGRAPEDHRHEDHAVHGDLHARLVAEPALQQRGGRLEEHGADQRAEERADAADDRHERRLDRDAEVERGVRVDEVDVLHVEGAGHRREEGGEHEDVALHARHVDADRFGGVLVFAERHEVVAGARTLDTRGYAERYEKQAEGDVVVRRLAVELHHERRVAEVRHRRGFRAPGEVAKLEEDEHQHLGGGDGGDGEVRPAQPEAEPADRQAGEERDEAARQHAEPRRDAVVHLEEARGIRPQAEERGMPERELLGVAAKQVPRRADEREEQDADQDVERERALHHERQHGDEHHDDRRDGAAPAAEAHQLARPAARPLGRSASVARSNRKTTIRPESAPMNWMPSDSAIPINRLATSAPTTLP